MNETKRTPHKPNKPYQAESVKITPSGKQLIELEIDRMSFGPAGVGRYLPPGEERAVVVFVNSAVPQDRLRVKVTKIHKNFWEADIVEILKPSPQRVAPPCPIFDRCGGCQWQQISYEAQVAAKREVVLHHLARSTKIDRALLESLTEVHPSTEPLAYRTRLQVRGDANGLGFYSERSRDLVILPSGQACAVAHPAIQATWLEFAARGHLAALSRAPRPPQRDLAQGQFKVEWTLTESGQVLEAINREHAAYGFTQVNGSQNKFMMSLVTRLAQHSKAEAQHDLLIDLYAGTGNLSRGLTRNYRNILCVEAFASREKELMATLAAGQILIRQKVEDFLKSFQSKTDRVNCIIADPPRQGLGKAASAIAGLESPLVILVSCDPSTLARDLVEFAGGPTPLYNINSIHIIDMFPQTYHVETVVSLSLIK